MIRPLLALPLALLLAAPASANDSIAELAAGGIVLSRSDVVAMESEDLAISESEVKVDYVFRNQSEADVDALVAFPMPDIEGSIASIPAIPRDADDNFLGFSLAIGGSPVTPSLDHRAIAGGIDVTADLQAQGVPLYPFGAPAFEALVRLPEAVAADWVARGIIIVDEYDDGSGMKKVPTPYWKLRSTYWWRTVFPAGKAVNVSHRYQPSVGGSVGLSFFYDGRFDPETYPDYKRRYCIDDGFEKAILKASREGNDSVPSLYETRLSYVLTTGGNWAGGTIGKFRLTVDKGDPKNLVSFCGKNVRKIGPTTFEMTAQDFYPAADLDILILQRSGQAQ